MAAQPHELNADEFERALELCPDDAHRAELTKQRFRFRVDDFLRVVDPDSFGRPFSDLHRHLFDKLDLPPWQERKADVKLADAAPRGFAKSTISTYGKLLHDIVYDLEAFIVLVSFAGEDANDFSTNLRAAFTNPDSPLAQMYGPFEVKGGVKRWTVSVQGRPPIAVRAVGYLGAIRGAKHWNRSNLRPTKVVIDDGEKDEAVRNSDQRRKWWQTLTKTYLKLGPPTGGCIYQVVGTVLHIDSMLAKILKPSSGWKSDRFQAIIKWPDRQDLWDRCKALWSNLALGDIDRRNHLARVFYEANCEAMNEGAILLDPGTKDLLDLHIILWTDGRASFNSEYQNDPLDPSTQIFFSDHFARFDLKPIDGKGLCVVRDDGRVIPVHELELRTHWDPAMGNADGDPAGICVMGRDQHGYHYVLDVWMEWLNTDTQLATYWALIEHFNVPLGRLESNGFQALVAKEFRPEQERREKAGEWCFHALSLVPEHANKEERIASTQPAISNGWVLFNRTIGPAKLLQYDAFPNADHDETPDTVAGAWSQLGRPTGGMVRMEAT